MKTFLPILSGDDAQDERSPGVVLLESGDEWKTTAEDRGDHYYVRDWEIVDSCDGPMWFDRSGYSISKAIVGRLYEHAHPALCAH